MKQKLFFLLLVAAFFSLVTGACWGLNNLNYLLGDRAPTPEERTQAKLIVKELAKAEVGDLVVFKRHGYAMDDNLFGVIRWWNDAKDTLGLVTLDGNFMRLWRDDETFALGVEEVVHRSDPRWKAHLDRMILGPTKATTHKATSQSSR